MYAKILVPLDGSKRAEKILSHVEEMAQRFDSELILVQIIETGSISMLIGSEISPTNYYLEWFEHWKEEAGAYLNTIQAGLREKGVRSSVIVNEGTVVEEIINIAEHEGVDLIAMASHGRTGLSQVFYGSVAAGILHRIDRPLLLIRSRG